MKKRPDWEGAATAAPGSNNPAAGKVAELAEETQTLSLLMQDHMAALDAATTRYNFIKTKELPDALAELGTSTWKSMDGHVTISLKDFVSGSLPKAEGEEDKEGERKRADAIAWLVKNDGEALIKTVITITFEKKQHSQAVALSKELKKRKLNFRMESGVHPQTLLAFARERLKNGKSLALHILGLSTGNYADIKIDGTDAKPKKSKAHSKPKPEKKKGGQSI